MIAIAYKGSKPGEGEVKFVSYADLPKLEGRWNVRGPFADEDTAKWSLTLKNHHVMISMSDDFIASAVESWVDAGRPNSPFK